MRVSVGDSVKIKKNLKINEIYYNSDGTGEYFIRPMCYFLGELATIRERTRYGYHLTFSNPDMANHNLSDFKHEFVWAEGMFDVISDWE